MCYDGDGVLDGVLCYIHGYVALNVLSVDGELGDTGKMPLLSACPRI